MKAKIEGKDYEISIHEEKDQILYEFKSEGKPVCVIGLNEHGQWESNTNFDENLIRQLGHFIEANEL